MNTPVTILVGTGTVPVHRWNIMSGYKIFNDFINFLNLCSDLDHGTHFELLHVMLLFPEYSFPVEDHMHVT